MHRVHWAALKRTLPWLLFLDHTENNLNTTLTKCRLKVGPPSVLSCIVRQIIVSAGISM